MRIRVRQRFSSRHLAKSFPRVGVGCVVSWCV
ncbi:hypothetical protein M3J09_011663 [Ascochyta lentis]